MPSKLWMRSREQSRYDWWSPSRPLWIITFAVSQSSPRWVDNYRGLFGIVDGDYHAASLGTNALNAATRITVFWTGGRECSAQGQCGRRGKEEEKRCGTKAAKVEDLSSRSLSRIITTNAVRSTGSSGSFLSER